MHRYSNSFLSTLNGRTFRQQQATEDSSVLPIHQSRSGVSRFLRLKRDETTSTGTMPTGVHVHVIRDKEHHVDGGSSGVVSFANQSRADTDTRQTEDWKESVSAVSSRALVDFRSSECRGILAMAWLPKIMFTNCLRLLLRLARWAASPLLADGTAGSVFVFPTSPVLLLDMYLSPGRPMMKAIWLS